MRTAAIVAASFVTLAGVGRPVTESTMAELAVRQPTHVQDETKKEKPADQQVAGSVADSTGKPIERAQVIFDGPKKATLLTDIDGRFTFVGPAGEYTVTVRKGDRTSTCRCTVEGNQLKPSSTLTLEPEEPPQ